MDAERKAGGVRPMRANYDPTKVEQVILEEAVGLHPEQVGAEALCLRIVSDPDDSREMDVAREAIRSLRRVGVFREGKDEDVEVTPAAVRVGELLAGRICVSVDSD
jgi:hypothetical protein